MSAPERAVPPPGSAVTRRTVTSSALWTSASALIGVPIAVVTTVLLARTLAPSGFGAYALYGFLLTSLGALADLGYGSALLRRGALAAGTGDEAALLRAVRAGTTWSLLQLPAVAGIGLLVLPSTRAGLVYALAAACSLGALGPSHYLVMTSNLKRSSQLKVATALVSSIATVWVAAASGRADLTFAVAALASTLPTFAQVVAVPPRLRRAVFTPGPLGLDRHDLLFGAGNLLHGQLSGFVFSRSELLFFTPAQSGARGGFAAAQTLAARCTLLIDALLGNLSTALTSVSGRGRDHLHRTMQLISDTVVLLLLVASPLALAALVVLSEPVLGRGYAEVGAPAVALGAVSLLQSGAAPLLSLRFAERSIRPVLMAGAVSAAVDVAAAAALVPAHGLWGAVAANCLGGGLFLAVSVRSFRRDGAEWHALATTHMARLVLVQALSLVVAGVLVLLPATAALPAALPLAVACVLLALRVPFLRPGPDTVVALAALMPRGAGRWFATSRVLGLPSASPVGERRGVRT